MLVEPVTLSIEPSTVTGFSFTPAYSAADALAPSTQITMAEDNSRPVRMPWLYTSVTELQGPLKLSGNP